MPLNFHVNYKTTTQKENSKSRRNKEREREGRSTMWGKSSTKCSKRQEMRSTLKTYNKWLATYTALFLFFPPRTFPVQPATAPAPALPARQVSKATIITFGRRQRNWNFSKQEKHKRELCVCVCACVTIWYVQVRRAIQQGMQNDSILLRASQLSSLSHVRAAWLIIVLSVYAYDRWKLSTHSQHTHTHTHPSTHTHKLTPTHTRN